MTRADLKQKAKGILKNKYWQFFAVMTVYSVLPLLLTPSMNLAWYMKNIGSVAAWGLMSATVIFSILIGIFLTDPLYVAVCRFAAENSIVPETRFGVIWELLKEHYFKTVKAVFMRNLLLCLWAIPFAVFYIAIAVMVLFMPVYESTVVIVAEWALVIAEICALVLLLYEKYSYSMTEFVLSEEPTLNWREAVTKSKEMMQGRTFFAFKLDLSFLGWQFLGLLAFGVGGYFVEPYIIATKAQFYLELKRETESVEYKIID